MCVFIVGNNLWTSVFKLHAVERAYRWQDCAPSYTPNLSPLESIVALWNFFLCFVRLEDTKGIYSAAGLFSDWSRLRWRRNGRNPTDVPLSCEIPLQVQPATGQMNSNMSKCGEWAKQTTLLVLFTIGLLWCPRLSFAEGFGIFPIYQLQKPPSLISRHLFCPKHFIIQSPREAWPELAPQPPWVFGIENICNLNVFQ